MPTTTMCFTNKLRFVLVCNFCAFSSLNFAQENTTVFWQPAFAVNYGVSKEYSHNFSLQNRSFLYTDGAAQLSIRQLDVGHFSNVRLRENQSLALGILYRLRDTFDGGANELRLTEQYNFRHKPFVVRYGHRFRAQQRFTSTRTTHRFRYRFGLDFPLQGEQLDVGEAYIIGTMEQLLSVAQQQKPQHDTRFTFYLGWQLAKKMKLQLGTEYRLEDFGQDLQHVLFFLSTVNLSL